MPPRKVLVVDDSKLLHRMFEMMLRQYPLVHAYDGNEALQRLSENFDVDLVLLDINMPVLNGLAFLEQKQRTPYASIPVIVLSAEGNDAGEVRHALSLGARSVLPKPFEIAQFIDALRSL